ncbi:MAG: tetratricopeptide repeat protein [Thermodesulfobacteriota bacterium]
MPDVWFRLVCLFSLGLTCIAPALLGCAALTPADTPMVTAQLELAEAYLQDDKPRRSLQELQHIENPGSLSARYQFDLGRTYMALEQWEQAETHFQQVVQQDPQHAKAWNRLGQVYMAQDNVSQAENAFQTALDTLTYLNPERAALHLAQLYRQTGEMEKAMNMAQKALRENERFLPAHLFLNELLVAQGRIDKALTRLQEAESIFPDQPQILLALAENNLRLGNTVYARTWFERILTVAPESEAAAMARDYLGLF